MRYCPQCRADLVEREIDNKLRSICADNCGFVHWDNPTPVVAAIAEYDGKVLLARNAKWPEGSFALISGFLERNETPEQSVLREVRRSWVSTAKLLTSLATMPFPSKINC